MNTQPKPRHCDICQTLYTPARMGQRACSVPCATKSAKKARKEAVEAARVERKVTRARKEAIKTIPDLIKEAQHAFNAYIRARDAHQLCISCGAPPPDLSRLHAGRDAGHYRSVGSASHLRFHEDNVHAQCVHCNQWGAGRAVDYRIGLVARIGLDAIKALETDNTPHKWTREELTGIRDTYRAKLKELKK
jgi:hypothetical protein